MSIARKLLPALLLLAACVAALAAAGWVGAGPLAGVMRALAGGGAASFLAARDVPRCGPAWRIVESPNPSKTYTDLRAVAALSPDNVWAVGVYGATEAYAQTLTLRWDGVRWSHVPSPSVPRYSNHVTAVAALSNREVWAVGGYHKDADFWQTLAMRWDGARWNMVPTPNLAPVSILNGVAALSPDEVWAVGEFSRGKGTAGGGSNALMMRWDGTAWRTLLGPGLPQPGTLNAVAALSSNDVWAVGSTPDSSGAFLKPLALHWDGTAWRNMQPPGAGELWSVAVMPASGDRAAEVWAVGNSGPRTLAMRWTGGEWVVVPTPGPGKGGNSLNAVTVAPNGEVWAVGAQNVGGKDRPLSIRWNGSRWEVLTTVSPGGDLEALYGIATTPQGETWAVGSYINGPLGTNQSLTQRHNNPCL